MDEQTRSWSPSETGPPGVWNQIPWPMIGFFVLTGSPALQRDAYALSWEWYHCLTPQYGPLLLRHPFQHLSWTSCRLAKVSWTTARFGELQTQLADTWWIFYQSFQPSSILKPSPLLQHVTVERSSDHPVPDRFTALEHQWVPKQANWIKCLDVVCLPYSSCCLVSDECFRGVCATFIQFGVCSLVFWLPQSCFSFRIFRLFHFQIDGSTCPQFNISVQFTYRLYVVQCLVISLGRWSSLILNWATMVGRGQWRYALILNGQSCSIMAIIHGQSF